MELTPVICNHCGASLQVADNARFVTCRYCNSQLEIKRTESSITTEVLQRIDQNTSAMAQDLHALRQESEIERLDREWEQTRATLLVRDKNGNTSAPSAAGGIIAAVVMGGFGLVWTIIAFSITASEPASSIPDIPGFPAGAFPSHDSFGPPPIVHIVFPLFGIVFMIAAIFIGIKTATAASQFDQEYRRYQSRRQELLGRQASEPSENAASNS